MRQKLAPTMIMSCNLDLERMYCFREVIQLEYKRMYVLTFPGSGPTCPPATTTKCLYCNMMDPVVIGLE